MLFPSFLYIQEKMGFLMLDYDIAYHLDNINNTIFETLSLVEYKKESWPIKKCPHPLLYIFRLAFIPVLCLFLTLILRYRRGTCWNWVRLTNCWLILFAEPTYRSFPVCGIYLLPLYIFLLILSSIKSTKTIFEVHSGHHRY